MKSAEQLAEEKYPETSDNRIRRAVASEKRKAFIEGYNADKWIPVEEELPEESGRYLVWVKEVNDLGVSEFFWNCCFHSENNTWTDNHKYYHVTHWQLVSPPKQNNQV